MENEKYGKIHFAQSGNGHWRICDRQYKMGNAKWAMGNRHANRVLAKVGRYAMHLFARMRNNRWSALRNVDHPL